MLLKEVAQEVLESLLTRKFKFKSAIRSNTRAASRCRLVRTVELYPEKVYGPSWGTTEEEEEGDGMASVQAIVFTPSSTFIAGRVLAYQQRHPLSYASAPAADRKSVAYRIRVKY